MPRQDLYAVRAAAGLTDRQSHRMVAFAALSEVTGERRPRCRWTHPGTARQLGVSEEFTALLGNYLEYRRVRLVSRQRGVRLRGDDLAQVYRVVDGEPLDLVRLDAGVQLEARLASVFAVAVDRKVMVDPDLVFEVEGMLGRACGMGWEAIMSAYLLQRAARGPQAAAA